jgi:uncharacterized protein
MSGNAVGWFEIYVQDLQRARTFYEAVLEVRLTKLGGAGLDMWSFPQSFTSYGASGALVRAEGVESGGNSTVVYFSCADCAVEGARVPGAGGRLLKEKFSIGEYGFIVLAHDPDGNLFGLHSMQ